MTTPPDLLDTNIFVHLVRGDAMGEHLKQTYGLMKMEQTPAFCVVSDGELRSLITQFKWGDKRQEQARYLLDYFTRISIETPGVYAAYAAIDQYSRSKGIRMGKNDLWIAAVANVSRFRLLTTDADFDHLDPVFLNRVRIAYDQGTQQER